MRSDSDRMDAERLDGENGVNSVTVTASVTGHSVWRLPSSIL